ncbi:MAG: cell division protein FtsX [Candidatus Aminicenantia bacterium]
MQKLKYILSQASTSLWQNKLRNFLSVGIISLSLFIFGIFLFISDNLQEAVKGLSENLQAIFFLEKDLTKGQQKLIEEKIKDSLLIKDYIFVSKEQALARFQKNFSHLKEIVSDLEENPFPASYEVTFKKGISSSYAILSFIEEMRETKGVEEVQFNQEWVEKLLGVSKIIKVIGFFLGGILLLASFFIISNVIKLNVYARQEEIEIFRLVGATNLFIKTPFIIEGVILGIIGGLSSLMILLIVIKLFPMYLGSSYSFIKPFIVSPFLTINQSLVLILGGGIIGLIGSLTSVGKFLKV